MIVELDGRAAHETTSRFDSDRERDRLLALAGWRVIRVTWKHVVADAERLAIDLRELLSSGR
jgi:very-short-patch-repair endonuclease